MARSESPPLDDAPGVRLDGAGVVDLGAAPRTAVSASFRCASGERWTGEWRGVPVTWVLDHLPESCEATHLRVHGPDGHVVCVALADAVGGILAEARLDGPPRAPGGGWPRFVAPRITGTRTVKEVRRLEPVTLAAGADVEEYETLGPAD